ncbi:HNH endonuclease [Nocardia farcinica]|uniref:HNH endonuclease signature motif containing protein n=1 Tax=Nocardia farcinica TaxID=37329 RepID=UPI001895F408|nr:HNH endonuclease signature motif containing protein [Nocardia farcinica]MBF6422891.1 HNH endonuclease [Nocardia farcinica]MBF6434511.1 HNH endonuclease [Nocardia farcinica]MBF6505596.1 HNH endonuclease [Nocardia farcinica]
MSIVEERGMDERSGSVPLTSSVPPGSVADAYVKRACVYCGRPVRSKTGADFHVPCRQRERERLAWRAERRAAGEPSVCALCGGEINYDQGFSGFCQGCREHRRYIPKPLRKMLLAPGAVCVYCGEPASCIDHVRPIASGGDSSPDNLEPCCAECNLDKNCQTLERWFRGPDSTPIGREAMRFSLAHSMKVTAEWTRLSEQS